MPAGTSPAVEPASAPAAELRKPAAAKLARTKAAVPDPAAKKEDCLRLIDDITSAEESRIQVDAPTSSQPVYSPTLFYSPTDMKGY